MSDCTVHAATATADEPAPRHSPSAHAAESRRRNGCRDVGPRAVHQPGREAIAIDDRPATCPSDARCDQSHRQDAECVANCRPDSLHSPEAGDGRHPYASRFVLKPLGLLLCALDKIFNYTPRIWPHFEECCRLFMTLSRRLSQKTIRFFNHPRIPNLGRLICEAQVKIVVRFRQIQRRHIDSRLMCYRNVVIEHLRVSKPKHP